jgi:uncharacterized protein YdhG (YjbR/CyaY superfamily)
MSKPTTVDEYLLNVPESQQVAFDTVWNAVLELKGDAEVALSYGVPALKLNRKPLIAVAAFKEHVGVYPCSPNVIKAFVSELATYEHSKGGFKVLAGQKVTKTLLKKLITARKKELET